MKSPILGGSSVARSTNAADARMVNLYAEATSEGGKEAGYLSRCPGLRTIATVGTGPIRGMWAYGGYGYVVSGLELYRLGPTFGSSLLGSVTGTGPVSMTDNGTQLFIACDGPGFIYNASTGVFSVIGDPDFAGAVSVGFIDGYFVFTQPNSQIFWVTTLYDGSSVDPLDFASAEGSPDGIVSMLVDHREVWMFGTNSVEVWYDAGNTDFPLARIQGAYAEVGCAATFSVAKLDNGIFWLGSDARGNGIVYRSKGYSPVRISTNAVEYAIQNYGDVSDAIAYTYQQQGHTFYVLTFPSADATWVYDASTNLWHERAGWGPNGFMRHRSNCQMNYGNEIIVGDYENGKLYALDLGVYTDDGNIQKWLRSWRAIPTGENNLKRSAQHSLQLDMEVGAYNTLVSQSPQADEAILTATLDSIAVNISVLAIPPYIFYAPLTSAYTNTDITASPLTPTTTIPAGASITYGTSNAIFNSLASPGAAPSITWATGAKLNASIQTTKTITISEYANITGITTGSGSAYSSGQIISFYWIGGSLTWFTYITAGGTNYLYLSYSTGGGAATSVEVGTIPAGENLYSIDWTPSGTVKWKVNGVARHTINWFSRVNAPSGIAISPAAYGGTYYGGVYQSAVRDALYTVGPAMYAWSTTGYTNGTQIIFSNEDRTVTWPYTTAASGNSRYTQSMQPLSGKVYCEFAVTAAPSQMGIGFGVQSAPVAALISINGGAMFSSNGGSGMATSGLYLNGTPTSSSLYNFTVGDRIGIAFDVATKKMWFAKNGNWIVGDPAAGTAPSLTLTTAAPFYFTWGTYSNTGLTNGNYSYAIYPDAATQNYSPPSGFTRYET